MVKRNDWGTDWDDAPDYIRSRRAKSRAYRLSNFRVYAITALIGGVVIIYGLISEFRLTSNSLSAGAQTAAEPMANPPPAMLDRPVPIQIPQELEPIKPSRTSLEPDTLDQCMGSDKLIDENVVRCRYGELPRSAPQAAKPQGMVSDEYLAQYRSERQDTARQARPNTSHRETESRTIHANGHSTVAIWGVVDNRIDYGSVCGNHPRGSIEYRECRKAAKAWFKLECRRWEIGEESGRQLSRERMIDRYCSAANGFSPMG